jgi:hypothetical protein
MSVYVLAPNDVVETYPYTLTDMILDNPTVSFSTSVSDETAARFSVYPVVETPRPEYDPITQNLIWANPDLIDGVWVQTWAIEPATQEEIAQRLEAKRRSMVVTPFQAKAALLDAGLLDDIEALIADPAADRKVVLAWTNAISFERLSPMVAGIAAALGWTDTQLDDLFDAAALIS